MTRPRRGPDTPTHATAYSDGEHWSKRGACRTVDPELFFAADGMRTTDRRRREAEAKAICDTCPVQPHCRQYALNYRLIGVWGATSDEDREQIRQKQRKATPINQRTRLKPATTRAGCGTANGHRNHDRNGEKRCDPCEAARLQAKEAASEVAARNAARRKLKPGPDHLSPEVEHLLRLGLDTPAIATALGRSVEALQVALRRRDRHDLLQQLRQTAA